VPILAGAYLPIDDLLYIAESGKGAYCNGKRLKIENSELKNSLVGFGIDFTDDTNFLDYGLKLYRLLIKNARNIRCTNSLVDFMMFAEGSLGANINMCTKIWDIAAPWLIIREAGGALRDIYNQEIKFELNEKSIYKNYSVMAGSCSILNEIASKQ